MTDMKDDSEAPHIFKLALERQSGARKEAEKIIEEKSRELHEANRKLRMVNERLEGLLNEKSNELEGIFVNIIDCYIVFDLDFNILKMNTATRDFLGATADVGVNFKAFLDKGSLRGTIQALRTIVDTGFIKNHRARIRTSEKRISVVQMNGSLVVDTLGRPIAVQGIFRDVTRELESHRLISEQKRKLDIIVDKSLMGIILVNNGHIIKCNQAMADFLDYQLTDLNAMPLSRIICQNDIDTINTKIEEVRADRLDSFTVTNSFVKRSQECFMAKISVNAFRNERRELEYLVMMVDDISKEVRAQRRLQESENRLSTLVANLSTGVLMEDKRGNVTLSNQRLCDLLHIPMAPDQLIGMTCGDALDDVKGQFADPEGFVDRTRKMLHDRTAVYGDEWTLANGRTLVRDYIPIMDQGLYQGHLWSYSDVTATKNYEKNLQAEKEKYRRIISNMNLGMVEVDNQEIIQMVNNSFCQISGFTEEELIGHKASTVLRVVNKGLVAQKNRDRQSGISDSYEIQVLDKKGRTRYWLISGTPIYNDRDKVLGSIGIHLDITGLKELEMQKEGLLKELAATNQGLEEYAHVVSHDLKSPLRSIHALSNWLQEDFGPKIGEEGMRNLSLMQEKVATMERLIDGVLKYSAIRAADVHNEPVDLNGVLQEILEVIYIPDHVQVEVLGKMPELIGDRIRIHQLFQNLLANAVAHIACKEGHVSVSCADKGDFWEFAVRDNGVGIPREYHDKIFKVFQSVGDIPGSTGIGLSIVKKIVEIYQGRIWLDSQVGKGSTFYFTLKKEDCGTTQYDLY